MAPDPNTLSSPIGARHPEKRVFKNSRHVRRLAAINGDYEMSNLPRMAANLNDIRDTPLLFVAVPEATRVASVLETFATTCAIRSSGRCATVRIADCFS